MKLRFHPLSLLLGLSLLLSPIHFTAPKAEESKAHVVEPEDVPSTTTLMGSGIDAASALKAAGLDLSMKPPLAWSCKTTKGQGFTINQKFISGGLVMIEWRDPSLNIPDGTEVFNVALGGVLNKSYDLPADNVEREVKIYTCTDDILELFINQQNLTELHIESLSNLEILSAFGNQVSNAQDLTTCTALKECNIYTNEIPSLDVLGLQNLEILVATGNKIDGTVSFSGCEKIEYINLIDNLIDNLYFDTPGSSSGTNHSYLQVIRVANNEIGNDQDLRACPNLIRCQYSERNMYTNKITALHVEGLDKLQILEAEINQIDHNMDLQDCDALKVVKLYNNKITSLDVRGLMNLETLSASKNYIIGTVDFTGCENIINVNLRDNQIETLLFDQTPTGNPELEILYAQGNLILNGQDLTGCTKLKFCSFEPYNNKFNQVSSVDISGLEFLEHFRADYNNISSILDLTGCKSLSYLKINNNYQIPSIILPAYSSPNSEYKLSHVDIKNNSISLASLESFTGNLLSHVVGGSAPSGPPSLMHLAGNTTIPPGSQTQTNIDNLKAAPYNWTISQ